MKMIEVKILGVTLEAPLLNPKKAREFEAGIKKVVGTVNKATECESGAKAIERQCNVVIDFIDEVFGTGSAKKVFGEETDLITCLDAWYELVDLYNNQVNPLLKGHITKMLERFQQTQVTEDES